jgi:hypothetical protein
MTPWNAARRLELLAKSWEKHGYNVERIYGTVEDMGTKGSEYNVAMVLNSWKK